MPAARLAARPAPAGRRDACPGVDPAEIHPSDLPFCAPIAMLARAGAAPSTDQRTPAPSRESVAFVLHEGEPLELALSGPDYDAFVHIAVVGSDGTVHRLLPSGVDGSDNRVAAGERFALGGEGRRGRQAFAAAPFGTEMVLVVASSTPLGLDGRKESEDLAAYLADLERGLSDARSRVDGPPVRIEYGFLMIATAPAGATEPEPRRPIPAILRSAACSTGGRSSEK